jgi:hypothetical protein
MSEERAYFTWPGQLNGAVVRALERAGQQPVDGCFDFVRAAAARLEPGLALPETLVTEQEPTEVGRGDNDGAYYYESSFRAGDAGRFVTLEITYKQPEEMMYPETHTWTWVYTVGGLSAGRGLILRCWRDAITGDTTRAAAVLEVAGSEEECAAVLAQFRTRFAPDITAR